ncbi:RelA/SpoT domain-containing protein [Paenibacillus sp. GM2FR]|uniref:RelA/SpoT domain-containing protein n=1 Tax=Paenibacillus sp. GM2FR TaxID=2059268 RepID=UPI000C278276|nr:RelA/SpoT domain-containing protein [Paenibacillus sp. GM2FR]
MKKVELRYSKKAVDRAGDYFSRILSEEFFNDDTEVSSQEVIEAYETLNNWRAVHGYPINTFQATLRNKLKSIDQNAVVAQRLKRTPSIISKLARFKGMKLSRMQDIGGLRAVVEDLSQVEELYNYYKNSNSKWKHQLVNEKNYIDNPKPSGYRGIHLVYRYYKNNPEIYNGLMIELQIRTRLQHAWATAVETMGTFLNSSLKSSEGPDEWLSFFALASSAFAYLEGKSLIPGYEHLSREETFRTLVLEEKRLKITEKLNVFRNALKTISSDGRTGSYYLLVLEPDEKKLTYTAYGRDRLEEATEHYLKEEQISDGDNKRQVVLVKASSVESLKKAYPNYFLDTHEFLNVLRRISKEVKKDKKEKAG